MKRAEHEQHPDQIDLEEAPRRRPTEPLPGTEQPPTFEQSVQSLYLDLHGREIPNPLPLAPPVGYKKSPTIAEQMRQMIRMASYEAAHAGAETEEEANDFDVGEDFDPSTPYEHDFEMDPAMEAMLALQSQPAKPASKPSTSTQEQSVKGSSEAPLDAPPK
ncbi:hypothetical protein [robinz microvirus RP_32]|nr:hypothetical protein [robinz microvirus RP_32]UDN67498.1 hypothetical protein [robinz microvirus RP_33]